MPFTEDDCLDSFGYWVEYEGDKGFTLESHIKYFKPPDKAEPLVLSAISFMSGAILAVQAESAHASIEA